MSQSLRDNEGNYLINGRKYKSVTTILKEEFPKIALDAWKERTPDWPVKAREARIYGTFMHMQLQSMVSPIPPEMPAELPWTEWPEDIAEELEARVAQWEALGLEMGQPCLVEHTVVIEDFDDAHKLVAASAGTLDYWGKIDGMKTLLDWKSSKRPQKSHRIQMGAYYLGALREGIEVEWGMIPYVRRNGVQIIELTPDEMKEEGERFLELARKSYERSMANMSSCSPWGV